MHQHSGQADRSAGFVRGTGEADGVIALTPPSRIGPRPSLLARGSGWPALAGHLGLLTLFATTTAIVVFAAAAPSVLVSRGETTFPGWLSPLHGVLARPGLEPRTVNLGLSAVLAVMALAYGAALLGARSLSSRAVVACIVALHAILLLSPALQLTDLFNYLAYARLGALHHLNPYTHTIGSEPHDPTFALSTWHHWHSPYGPLFTAATYPLAWLPLPVAYWMIKTITVVASLAFLALVARCARALGHDARCAVLLVAANPLYLVYAVGGFHNDFFMLALSTAAIALLLARRDRAAGAALTAAIGIKFTVVLLLPFLLLAAGSSARRRRLLFGAALAAIPLATLSIALFGLTLPNVSGQSNLITDRSVPNLLGLALGLGGAVPALLHALEVAVVLVVLHQLRGSRDWLAGAGWATLALVASIAWLMPWYVIWALPLSALSDSKRLRRTALAFAAFILITFLPATTLFLKAHHIGLVSTRAVQQAIMGQRSFEQ